MGIGRARAGRNSESGEYQVLDLLTHNIWPGMENQRFGLQGQDNVEQLNNSSVKDRARGPRGRKPPSFRNKQQRRQVLGTEYQEKSGEELVKKTEDSSEHQSAIENTEEISERLSGNDGGLNSEDFDRVWFFRVPQRVQGGIRKHFKGNWSKQNGTFNEKQGNLISNGTNEDSGRMKKMK